jgi:hypothetical protein
MGDGQMFDFIDDPFHEKPLDPASDSQKASGARKQLQTVLDKMAVEREKEDRRLIAAGLYDPNAAEKEKTADSTAGAKNCYGNKSPVVEPGLSAKLHSGP